MRARHAAAVLSIVAAHVAARQACAGGQYVAFGALRHVVDGFGPHQPVLAHPLRAEVDGRSRGGGRSFRRGSFMLLSYGVSKRDHPSVALGRGARADVVVKVGLEEGDGELRAAHLGD